MAEDEESNLPEHDELEGGGRKFCQESLTPLLRSGAIALLDSDWLLHFQGTRISRRQELPPEAFISFRQLEEQTRKLDIDGEELTFIIALSYMWLSDGHPDPDGMNLGLLRRSLSIVAEDDAEDGVRRGIFWDFASLHQRPRSGKEESLFRRGLSGILNLYLHPDIIGFQITEHTREPTIRPTENEGRSAKPYLERGWPFVEHCALSLLKRSGHVFDLSLLDKAPSDVANGRLILQPDETACDAFRKHCSVSTKRVILVPEDFDRRIVEKSFMNGLTDCNIVRSLYRSALVGLFRDCITLHLDDMGWGNSEASSVISLMRNGYVPNVECLRLERNNLTGAFCRKLVGEPILDHTNLRELQIGGNQLGEEGFEALLPLLPFLDTLWLSNVSLTSVGCTSFMKKYRASGANQGKIGKLNEIVLSQNRLGCSGVSELAPFLVRIPYVELDQVECRETGCRSLVEQLSNDSICRLVSLKFDESGIGDDGFSALAPAIVRLELFSCRGIGLTSLGCAALSKEWAVAGEDNRKLVELDLSYNTLGDNGLRILAPLLAQLSEIHLAGVGATEVGCQALVDEFPASWEEIHLERNMIRSSAPLLSIATLESLSVFVFLNNPLSEENFATVKDLCDSRGVWTYTSSRSGDNQ